MPQPQPEHDGDVATAEGHLSITDSRTGKSYRVQISDGAIRATDLRQIKAPDNGVGLMSYDPGFLNTASCRSAITFIDGAAGRLEYRGYPIEELCKNASYLEVAYLLIYGQLPTREELDEWMDEITHHTFLHKSVETFIGGFRYDADPMGMLLGCVGALSTFYPQAKQIHDVHERYMAAVRLIAKMPTLAAFAYRHSRGLPYVYPDNELSYAGNFLAMMFRGVMDNPDPRLERALEVLWIVHADHEQHCSTSAVRLAGSSLVDPYSAMAAGLAALYGPLHPGGGASEGIPRMLERIGSVDNVADFLGSVKAGKERLLGFGHPVYQNYDPRARIIKSQLDEVYEATGKNRLAGAGGPLMKTAPLRIATEIEKRALEDEYFVSHKLYPNVDFYSGLIYEALNLPTEMFTVMAAIPRTAGWLAQWLEMIVDEETTIARPRQIYHGDHEHAFVPLDDRPSINTRDLLG